MHVCEAMISAASECLHKYTIDVIFVIYSSNGFNEEDECYQVILSRKKKEFFFCIDFLNRFLEFILIVFVNKLNQTKFQHQRYQRILK
jgi:hypothetical protein